jgi:hypothetical protein
MSDIKERTQPEGVWEQGAEGNIWTEERWRDGRLEKKLHKEELHDLYSSPSIIRMIKARMDWQDT